MKLQWKKIGQIAMCAAVLLLAVGCKDKKDDPQVPEQETESIVGNVSKPAWTVTDDYDMTASMTAIVKVDMTSLYSDEQLSEAKYELSDEDLLAAFSGDSCLGMAEWIDGVGHIYIGNTNAGVQSVQLKYYSTVLKNIFADTELIPFVVDENKGTVSQPYTPSWALAK